MIFGCSAGGASVAGMLTMPDAFGLYQAAGIESPGGHQGWMTGDVRTDDDWTTPSLNRNHSLALAAKLGCQTPTNLTCLHNLSVSTVFDASTAYRFAPALAVEGDFPLGLIAAGRWNKVPVIIGGQSCESCSSAVSAFGPYTRNGVTDEQVRTMLTRVGVYVVCTCTCMRVCGYVVGIYVCMHACSDPLTLINIVQAVANAQQ